MFDHQHIDMGDSATNWQKNTSFLKIRFDRDLINLYPWPLLCRTFLLWFSFFCCGLADSVRGPTLLDLTDLIKEDVSALSSTFALRALGGLFGCLMSGAVLDLLSPSSRYIFIAVAYFVISFCTVYLPYAPNLLVMQIVSAVFGFFNGSFHTATNPLLLKIWDGRNSSPYMYAMHFFFGLGALLAPIVAKPFLREHIVEEVFGENDVFQDEESYNGMDENFWSIKTLYPIIGLSMLIAIPVYIYFFVQELSREKKEAMENDNTVNNDILEDRPISKCKKILLIMLMAVFYFTFAGLESSYRSFTTAFGVSSSLNLSRHEAADILAVFYCTFAAMRGLIIPLSAFASPSLVLWSSLSMLCIAAISLSLWAEASIFCLKAGVALTGAGVASIFASGMLWLKNVIPVTNKVGSVPIVSCCLAAQVYSIVIGNYIESTPMVFIHLMTGTMMCLVISFGLANIVADSVRRSWRN